MKKIEIGYVDNLEYYKVQDKVRAIILDKEGKALVTKYAGLYMLPGGKIEEGETEKQALRREILEETGIDIEIDTEIDNKEPFLEITTYNQNYYDRKAGKEINRKRKTTFYSLKTNQSINRDKRSLTESEKEQGYECKFVNLSIIEYLVRNNKFQSFRRDVFDKEILIALREYANYKKKSIEKSER